MKLLIVAATKEEIYPSIRLLEEMQIPYLITGVGMTATAYALGKYLALHEVDLVINVGIAGSFDKSIPLGEVITITKDTFSELGAEDDKTFTSIENLGFGQATYRSTNSSEILLSLKEYEGITVNTVHGNEGSIKKLQELFPTVAIESMEGASVFYVCSKENTNSLQVRAISNYVEKRDKSTWNIPLAVKNLNLWLENFIDKQMKFRHN